MRRLLSATAMGEPRAWRVGALGLGLCIACAVAGCALPLLSTPSDLAPTAVRTAIVATGAAKPSTATAPATARSVATTTRTPRGASSATPTWTATVALTPTSSATATATPSPTASATASSTPLPTHTARPTPVATLNAAGQVGLGLYSEGIPYDRFASVEAFERLTRHKMEYVLWFQTWGDEDRDFPVEWLRLAANKGLLPVITWEPWKRDFQNPTAVQPDYDLASIAAGRHDGYIRAWAEQARAIGIPFVLRFAHEQSTEPGVRSWYPWQGDPQGFRAAFGHIVTVFRATGAHNVQFLWSGMWLNSWAEQYYPGPDVVDWIGTTVLNHGLGADADWAQWRSFDELFAGQYHAAQRWGKPIMLTELASAEQGGDKAAWLQDCFGQLQIKYPLVRGILLLEVQSDREWPAINWSISSSPASLEAFVKSTSDAYYR